jgi:hypothetical protein
MIEQARELLAAGAGEAEGQEDARRDGLSQFWSARVTTAVDHTACPYELPSDGDDVRVQIVSEANLALASGPRFAVLSAEKTRLMAEILLLDRPTADEGRDLLAEVEGAVQPWTWDITLITNDFSRPRFTHDGVYFPGMVGGQVVLWDYQTGRVACAARVAETNSPDVLDRGREAESALFEADPVAFLEADLVRVAWEGAFRDIRQFEPDGTEAPPGDPPAEGSSAE